MKTVSGLDNDSKEAAGAARIELDDNGKGLQNLTDTSRQRLKVGQLSEPRDIAFSSYQVEPMKRKSQATLDAEEKQRIKDNQRLAMAPAVHNEDEEQRHSTAVVPASVSNKYQDKLKREEERNNNNVGSTGASSTASPLLLAAVIEAEENQNGKKGDISKGGTTSTATSNGEDSSSKPGASVVKPGASFAHLMPSPSNPACPPPQYLSTTNMSSSDNFLEQPAMFNGMNLVEAELVRDASTKRKSHISDSKDFHGGHDPEKDAARVASLTPSVLVEAVEDKGCIHNNLKWIIGGGVVFVALVVVIAILVANGGDDEEINNISGGTTGSSTTTILGGGNSKSSKSALVIVGVQDCFLEPEVSSTGQPGTLKVANSASLIPVINQMREEKDCLFDLVVRSNDYHPKMHISFASTHGLPPFAHTSLGKGGLPITCMSLGQRASCCPTYWLDPDSQNCDSVLCPNITAMSDEAMAHVLESEACTFCQNGDRCATTKQAMWPDHCIQNEESGVPPSLYTDPSDIVLVRGENDYVDGYSAFMDNTETILTPLDSILQSFGIETVYLMGLTTDYGIAYAASHARKLNYKTNVILDATRYIAQNTKDAAVDRMKQEGVTILSADDFLNRECPTTLP